MLLFNAVFFLALAIEGHLHFCDHVLGRDMKAVSLVIRNATVLELKDGNPRIFEDDSFSLPQLEAVFYLVFLTVGFWLLQHFWVHEDSLWETLRVADVSVDRQNLAFEGGQVLGWGPGEREIHGEGIKLFIGGQSPIVYYSYALVRIEQRKRVPRAD